jgi:hypothetical protein
VQFPKYQFRQSSVAADGDLAATVTRLQKTFIFALSILSSGGFLLSIETKGILCRKDAVDFESVEYCTEINGLDVITSSGTVLYLKTAIRHRHQGPY